MLILFLITFSISVVISIYNQSIEPLIIIGVVNLLAFWACNVFLEIPPEPVADSAPTSIASLDIKPAIEALNPGEQQMGSKLEELPPVIEIEKSGKAEDGYTQRFQPRSIGNRNTSDYF
ncbi:hypothetical protein RBE51_17970 [Pseudomonas taiwanensis]|uniref:hypothetical protein n=1 Tax=Pseudomonas taiwanensis TaxID=470150 RepID=UPI0028DDA6F1|nr:hypothetical protein [Pseudomonas taiwanensis]MDT8924699.1 hypothetical protein [Pseudomonas taiwanensis]